MAKPPNLRGSRCCGNCGRWRYALAPPSEGYCLKYPERQENEFGRAVRVYVTNPTDICDDYTEDASA